MSRTRALLLPALICLCCSCNRQADPKQKAGVDARVEIVARVGDERITAAEFQSEWNRRRRSVNDPRTAAEQREQLLEEMVREKAALTRARISGLDRAPDTAALIDRLIATRYLEAEFARRFASDPVVGDGEITAYYESNSARFHIAPAVRAGFIWLKLSSKAGPEQRAAMLEQANRLHAQAAAADAAAFKALVQQHSEDQATRYTGGDTGWLREGAPAPCDPAVVAAAFSLQQPGELAPLVTTANGFYVVRLLERQPAATRPLAEVREAIRYELQREKRQQREQEFFADLKRGLKIEVNRALLESVSTPAPASTAAPPALPGG